MSLIRDQDKKLALVVLSYPHLTCENLKTVIFYYCNDNGNDFYSGPPWSRFYEEGTQGTAW